MNFDHYTLIYKSDVADMKNRINELEKSNKELLDSVDMKRAYIVDQTSKKMASILKAGHRMADRTHCSCENFGLQKICYRCRTLISEWKDVAGE
jgi:diphthamide biosynthesis methyltransferase